MFKILSLLFCLNAAILQAQKTDTLFIAVKDVKLHTVITQAENTQQQPPLVIFIGGSGPTDLNGNQPVMQNNSLMYLSDALAAKNISTLRYDKRGVGKSVYANFNELDLRIDTYADDLSEIVKAARTKGFAKIFLAGHSEGSLIGLIAAQQTPVDGFISLCGAGNSADSLLKKQLQPKLPVTMYQETTSVLDSLKAGKTVQNYPPQLFSLFRPSVQPYLISWFKYDPASLINKLTCPVLVIQGDKDLQVDLEEAHALCKNLSKETLVIIPGMNHILKHIEGGIQDNMASYGNPLLPIKEELIEQMVEFIKQ